MQVFFKQDAMRDHLRRCLESGKLTMFPLLKNRMPRKEVWGVEKIDLYCLCRTPQWYNAASANNGTTLSVYQYLNEH